MPMPTKAMAVVALSAVLVLALVARRRWTAPTSDSGEVVRSQAEDRVPCDVLDLVSWRGRLPTLRKLSLTNCGLKEVSPNIKLCVNLETLDLAHNDLTTLPDELALLSKLEILFVLGSRRMTTMPRVLGKLKTVTRLGLRSNGVEVVTADGLPPLVEHLILTDNKIRKIEDAAYIKLHKVRKLMLANNELTEFTGGADPAKNLGSLELVRLANNKLRSLPDAILRLPRLSWIALAGNAELLGERLSPQLPRLKWDDVDASGQALGSGASGVVRAATWQGTPVAVKRILEKSSDGRALDEVHTVDALFGNGDEPPDSLVRTLAVIDADQTALVMELLPRAVRDLAKPPTIIEITRDRYQEAERFTPRFVYLVATKVCAALVHLHQHKVCHGDVYAHNTLVDDTTTTVKLGDLGASFVYAGYRDQPLFEKVEVRAFGVLLAELASRVTHDVPRIKFKASVLKLANACLDSDIDRRPSFGTIQALLDKLDPR